MESLFDVVVSEPLALDTEADRSVFESWVRGLSVREVIMQRLADFHDEVAVCGMRMHKIPSVSGGQLSFQRGCAADKSRQEEASSQQAQLEGLYARDTADAFCVFETIEHFLCQPEHLRGQVQVQLGHATQAWMVQKYHEVDDSVLREVLGKKISSKTRKDLDDVSELTRVPLKSCRRQFDNIRRLLSNLEDISALPHLSVVREVQSKLGLPLWLAAKYTAIVFLFHLRFQLQSSRKYIAHMTADDLCWSAIGMLNYWVGSGEQLASFEHRVYVEATPGTAQGSLKKEPGIWKDQNDDSRRRIMVEGLLQVHGLDFDKKWIRMLRIIKAQLLGVHTSSVFGVLLQFTMKDLEDAGLSQPTVDAIYCCLRSSGKALVFIGSGLSMSKEYRGVFEDLIEKVGNPLRNAGLGLSDISLLLEALVRAFSEACSIIDPQVASRTEMVDAWRRYLYGVRICFRYAYRNQDSRANLSLSMA